MSLDPCAWLVGARSYEAGFHSHKAGKKKTKHNHQRTGLVPVVYLVFGGGMVESGFLDAHRSMLLEKMEFFELVLDGIRMFLRAC